MEVDFIIGDQTAIEVKSGRKVTKYDYKGLIAIKEEKRWKNLIIVSQDPVETHFKNGIKCMHWEKFLTRLWKNQIL